MNCFLQVLKLNDLRKGIGKQSQQPYEMQDAECVILNEAGEPDSVGVLMIPKALMGTVHPGIYAGTFAMRASNARDGGRRIEAVLTGLRPVKKSGTGFVPVEAPKAP